MATYHGLPVGEQLALLPECLSGLVLGGHAMEALDEIRACVKSFIRKESEMDG